MELGVLRPAFGQVVAHSSMSVFNQARKRGRLIAGQDRARAPSSACPRCVHGRRLTDCGRGWTTLHRTPAWSHVHWSTSGHHHHHRHHQDHQLHRILASGATTCVLVVVFRPVVVSIFTKLSLISGLLLPPLLLLVLPPPPPAAAAGETDTCSLSLSLSLSLHRTT